jgi:hypothetical protein
VSDSHLVDVTVKMVEPGRWKATARYHGLTWLGFGWSADEAEKRPLALVETGLWCGKPMENAQGYVE